MLGFRVWDLSSREPGTNNHKGWMRYVDSDDLLLSSDGRVYERDECFGMCHNEKLIPMQSTGIKDERGIEIYEGDILFLYEAGHNHYYQVTNVVDFLLYVGRLGSDLYKTSCEGNIYTQPFLLERLKS